MDPIPYVMFGDLVASSQVEDRESFQKMLDAVCQEMNRRLSGYFEAEFKIIKGIDEIGAVLTDVSKVFEVVSTFFEELHPDRMRFVVVRGVIDTAFESRDVSKMDGPAFHRAAFLMERLKRTRLLFDMSTGGEIIDSLISGQINLLLMARGGWSATQRRIIREYEKTGIQSKVAENLGITQQAVSRALRRSNWKEIHGIEERLRQVFWSADPGMNDGGEGE